MSDISFGVRVPNSGPLTSVANISRAAIEAEQMGFDSIFVHDHVVWSTEMHRHHISWCARGSGRRSVRGFFEALTTIGYLAAKTSRVKIGVACLVMPTRNPIYAAKQLATLDHLSGGRLIAGIGLGSKASRESSEFDVFGVPFGARARMTDEFVEAMRAIWTQPLASYSGRHIEFKDAEIFPSRSEAGA